MPSGRERMTTEWALGVLHRPVERVIEDGVPDDVRWIEAAPGHFYADPFVVERAGSWFLFFEDLDEKSALGHIAVIITRDFESFSDPVPVLTARHHLSYPMIVEDDGRVFMIPEQYQTREVALYEAVAWPDRWERRSTLVRGIAALDPTVTRIDDTWWMALTSFDVGHTTALYLFHSRRLDGPWLPHPMNPISFRNPHARGAGRWLHLQGGMYRPAQNCEERYGAGVIVNRVKTLTGDVFEEEPVAQLQPRPSWAFNAGLHTLAAAGSVTVVDGCRVVPDGRDETRRRAS